MSTDAQTHTHTYIYIYDTHTPPLILIPPHPSLSSSYAAVPNRASPLPQQAAPPPSTLLLPPVPLTKMVVAAVPHPCLWQRTWSKNFCALTSNLIKCNNYMEKCTMAPQVYQADTVTGLGKGRENGGGAGGDRRLFFSYSNRPFPKKRTFFSFPLFLLRWLRNTEYPDANPASTARPSPLLNRHMGVCH